MPSAGAGQKRRAMVVVGRIALSKYHQSLPDNKPPAYTTRATLQDHAGFQQTLGDPRPYIPSSPGIDGLATSKIRQRRPGGSERQGHACWLRCMAAPTAALTLASRAARSCASASTLACLAAALSCRRAVRLSSCIHYMRELDVPMQSGPAWQLPCLAGGLCG